MLKIIQFTSLVIFIALSIFNIATHNFTFVPYTSLLLGVIFLVTGIIELQKDKKKFANYFAGYILIAATLYNFFVFIQGF